MYELLQFESMHTVSLKSQYCYLATHTRFGPKHVGFYVLCYCDFNQICVYPFFSNCKNWISMHGIGECEIRHKNYFVLWPTNAQLFHQLSHCYMFRHYRIILRELVINTLPSYTAISNTAVGNTIYNSDV